MTDSGNTVFVYGTLKPGGHYWPAFCAGKVRSIVPAKIRGELYDLQRGYPGLRCCGQSWVQGVLLHFPLHADFARVDALRAMLPVGRLRTMSICVLKCPCFSPAGEPLGTHWTYEVTLSVLQSKRASRIDSGIWPVDGAVSE